MSSLLSTATQGIAPANSELHLERRVVTDHTFKFGFTGSGWEFTGGSVKLHGKDGFLNEFDAAGFRAGQSKGWFSGIYKEFEAH